MALSSAVRLPPARLVEGCAKVVCKLRRSDGGAAHGQHHGLRRQAQHVGAQVKGLQGKALPQGRVHQPGQHGRGLATIQRAVFVKGAVGVGAGEDAAL